MEALWNHSMEVHMPVNLSIKSVPDHIAERLRARAAQHHRSIQGELMAILEESLGHPQKLSPAELLARVRSSGLKTPAESSKMTRRDRDERARR
jgi:antitoxin FitA